MSWSQAFENIKQAREPVARRYDEKQKEHTYAVGDSVLYRKNVISSKALNISAKLMNRWSEPLIIAKFTMPNVVLLANPDTGVIIRRADVSQLNATCLSKQDNCMHPGYG
jgi:hypothetical protein